MANPTNISTAEIQTLLNKINTGGVDAAIHAYNILNNAGYNYAGWAQGVAKGNSLAGQSALHYLDGSAMMGLGGNACRALTADQITKIRIDMAKATLEGYKTISRSNNGILNRDFNYDEIKLIHKNVLNANNLNLKNWTLDTPMELIRQKYGDKTLNNIWEMLRNTGGSGTSSNAASAALLKFMFLLSIFGNDDEKKKAKSWIDQFDDISTWKDIISKVISENIKSLQDSITQLIQDLSDIFNLAKKFISPFIIDMSPLIIDMDGDGVETLSQTSSNTYFDHDNNGFAERSGWVGTGLTIANTILTRNGDDLKLSWGTTDSVTLKNYFYAVYSGCYRVEQIKFADGTTWLLQDVADKLTYDGTTAHDTMSGLDDYANRINGGIGNDQIAGGKLADTLKGDSGDDTLAGHAGNDTLSGGTGADYLDGGSGSDTYIFNLGDGHDIISEGGDNTDTDVLKLGTGLTIANTILTRNGDDLKLSWGTTDSVTLKNYFSSESSGTYRIEQIKFADGTTWQLQDVTTRTTLENTTDNDNLNGTSSNDSLSGGTGNDILKGYEGNDTLTGGTGNDSLNGSYGGDTYIFNMGDGHDIISESEQTSEIDILKLGTGLTISNTVLARIGNHLKLSWGTSESIIIENYFSSSYGTAYQVEQIEFADGTRWLAQDIADKLTQNGTEADDTMSGFNSYTNRINGGGGNDTISGGRLADSLKGDAGNDTLNGYEGNDTLTGGTGNDSLSGSTGSDTYIFNKGDGHDIILDEDWSSYSGPSGEIDILKLGTGLTPAHTTLSRVGGDLKLSWGTTDSITIKNYFDSQYGAVYRLEQIEFADGTRWLAQDLANKLTYNGTEADDTMSGLNSYANSMNGGAGNDSMVGGNLADTLKGDAGNDTLHGCGGNDTLIGGTGNDSMNGSSDSDTYVFNMGDGHDVILDADWSNYSGSSGAIDILKLGTGLTPANTTLSRVGGDLKLSWGTTDSITIKNYFDSQYGAIYRLEQIEFADGTRWLTQDIANKLTYDGTEADDTMWSMNYYATRMNGGGGNDSMSGSCYADNLKGDAGNDTLSGIFGNDTLTGGTGDDSLEGGDGSDTYIFNQGDGHDTIYDWAPKQYWGHPEDIDILKLGSGLTVANTVLSRVGNHLKLSWGATDSVTIKSYFFSNASTTYQIEQIEFADGTRWLVQDIASKLIYDGTEADDSLSGLSNYANRINGGGGDDSISGGSLTDTLKGDAGNDILNGYDGNDTLDGGTGNDTLNGGAGNDVYLFGRGAGADVISDYDSTTGNSDILSIGAGITKEQLWFRREGNNLEVSIIGTNDKTTIRDWYSGTDYRLESFKTSSGNALLQNQVDALVSAMAAFAPPASGQTSLPANYQSALTPVIAASWQ